MTARRRLPGRRRSEIVELEVDGIRYTITAGRFSDGQLAELFIDGPRTGTTAQVVGRDAGILASLCLQHGIPAREIIRTLTQLKNGEPASVVGAALAAFT